MWWTTGCLCDPLKILFPFLDALPLASMFASHGQHQWLSSEDWNLDAPGGLLVDDWLVPNMKAQLSAQSWDQVWGVTYTPRPSQGQAEARTCLQWLPGLASLRSLSCLSGLPLPPHPLWFSPGSNSFKNSLSVSGRTWPKIIHMVCFFFGHWQSYASPHAVRSTSLSDDCHSLWSSPPGPNSE